MKRNICGFFFYISNLNCLQAFHLAISFGTVALIPLVAKGLKRSYKWPVYFS